MAVEIDEGGILQTMLCCGSLSMYSRRLFVTADPRAFTHIRDSNSVWNIHGPNSRMPKLFNRMRMQLPQTLKQKFREFKMHLYMIYTVFCLRDSFQDSPYFFSYYIPCSFLCLGKKMWRFCSFSVHLDDRFKYAAFPQWFWHKYIIMGMFFVK